MTNRALWRANGYGNPVEQRLSSYRMSMLAHGFVDRDEGGRHEFVPDESGPMTYAVLRPGQQPSTGVVWAVIAIVVTIAIVVVFA